MNRQPTTEFESFDIETYTEQLLGIQESPITMDNEDINGVWLRLNAFHVFLACEIPLAAEWIPTFIDDCIHGKIDYAATAPSRFFEKLFTLKQPIALVDNNEMIRLCAKKIHEGREVDIDRLIYLWMQVVSKVIE